MKHFTYRIIISLLFFLGSAVPAFATFQYYNHSEPYVVVASAPTAISVDLVATPNSMVLPTNQTVLSWTTTGNPTSCTAYLSSPTTTWDTVSPNKNPAGSGASPETVSGLSAGTYTFGIRCTKAGVADATDSALVVVTAAQTPSGTLSVPSCSISLGGSSCNSTISWTTANLTANPTSITRNTGSPSSFTPSPLASGSQGTTLSYGPTVFSLIHNGSTLATSSPSVGCASGSWNGSTCSAGSPINGMCGPSHWNCIQGTSSDQTGSGSGPWTWTCRGSNGGSDDFCTETGGGGGGDKPECSDGSDNDGDGFTDYPDDLGCSSELDPSELDKRKPIFIEF